MGKKQHAINKSQRETNAKMLEWSFNISDHVEKLFAMNAAILEMFETRKKFFDKEDVDFLNDRANHYYLQIKRQNKAHRKAVMEDDEAENENDKNESLPELQPEPEKET